MHMNRFRDSLLVMFGFGLFAAGSAGAAQLTQVARSTWTGGLTLPSYVEMYIYVPDKLATNPPIVVSSHSCGSTATGQMGNMTKTKAETADQHAPKGVQAGAAVAQEQIPAAAVEAGISTATFAP
jgi:poly(3-hydroxybutyrate) depolymerase